jgi:hypothetical protein
MISRFGLFAVVLSGWALAGAGAGEGDPQLHEVTDRLLPSGAFNVVCYAAPREVKLADLGLREAGLQGAPLFQQADEIRIFAARDRMEERPQARLWFNTRENAWWYHTGGSGSAMDFVLRAGEVLVIVTKASTNALPWVNPLR